MDSFIQFLKDAFYVVSINGIGDLPKLLAYFVPFVIAWTAFHKIKEKREKKNLDKLKALEESGMGEPVSLHPIIDYNKCLGCGTCVSACPEGEILGIVNDKAMLIHPTACIGHGACRDSCPQNAITLVFGTAKRGVDIPILNPDFETNIPGIFISGELGGMGLIRNATNQGKQAIAAIARKPGLGQGKALDVVIVGAGPAGISASLAAMEKRLRCITIEQDTLGGTVAHYPRGKIVMTSPVELPIYGKVSFRETNKESLLELWEDVVAKTGVQIQFQERMENITRHPEGFIVETSRHRYLTKNILLAIGRRGTPRKLNVPGEEQSKVVYSLTDPEQYRGKKVLVVGGGNSALEAAHSIADEPDTTVTLSYRSAAFSRAAPKNLDKVKTMENEGKLQVLLESNIKEIGVEKVTIEHKGEILEQGNDVVIVCAGGVLPTPLLKKIGIEVDTKFGSI